MLLEHGEVLVEGGPLDHLEQVHPHPLMATLAGHLERVRVEGVDLHPGFSQEVVRHTATLRVAHQPPNVPLPLRLIGEPGLLALLLFEYGTLLGVGVVFVRHFWGRYPLHLVVARLYALPHGYHGGPSGAFLLGGRREPTWRGGPRLFLERRARWGIILT